MEDRPEQTQELSSLETFHLRAREAMGQDEHAKRLTFEDLDETDMVLFDLYEENMLAGDRIVQAVADAEGSGQRSSALFRGWLANMMTTRMLRRK